MVLFPVIKEDLRLMALFNVAPVSVVLEVARLVPQLKAHVVLRGLSLRALLMLSCFYDVALQFHPHP